MTLLDIRFDDELLSYAESVDEAQGAATTRLASFLAYKDAEAAIAWLTDTVGFEKVLEVPDEERGGITHAELRLGDAVLVVYTAREDYDRPSVKGTSVGHGLYLNLPSEEAVNAVWEKALETGATPLVAPELMAWGNYRCDVLDLGGYNWTFGTYVPGNPPSW